MWKFLKNLFGIKNEEEDFMKKFLIVGLGNIGSDYADTRHNVGFTVLDFLANVEEITFKTEKLGSKATFKYKGRTFILIKPSTYMNLSGKAVKYWLTKEKIQLDNLLIITDDLNLPFGTLRLKIKGSAGGHNGLQDIQELLGTTKYNRLRFGVGDDFSKGRQVDYVLGKWTEAEQKQLPERFKSCAEIIKSFALAGVNNTMNTFNGK
jgi:PTH1 family peptidyl-tRNA hydrolase